jgi:chorismate mutase-like protein
MTNSLEHVRAEIDELDNQIIPLLNRRAALAVEIGAIKQARGEALYAPARERDVLNRLIARNQGPLPHAAVCRIYGEIMASALAIEHHHELLIGGAAEKQRDHVARFFGGGNAGIAFFDDPDLLIEQGASSSDVVVVVAEAWRERVAAALAGLAEPLVWRGCWPLVLDGAANSRFHVFARQGGDASARLPATCYCLVKRGPNEPLPPPWLEPFPVKSVEFWEADAGWGMLRIKLEMSAREARDRVLPEISRQGMAWLG